METSVHTKPYPLMPPAKLYSQQPKTGNDIHKRVQRCHGTLLGNKYEQTIDTHKLAESQGNYAKWKKRKSSKLHRKQELAKLPQHLQGRLRGDRHATWPAALLCQGITAYPKFPFLRWELEGDACEKRWPSLGRPLHHSVPHTCNDTRQGSTSWPANSCTDKRQRSYVAIKPLNVAGLSWDVPHMENTCRFQSSCGEACETPH